MRIAIPLSEDWIAPVVDSATRLLVVDVEAGRNVEQSEVPSFIRPPEQRAAELDALGIDLLLCDGISDALARRLRGRGIAIRRSISRAVDEILSILVEESRMVGLWPALTS